MSEDLGPFAMLDHQELVDLIRLHRTDPSYWREDGGVKGDTGKLLMEYNRRRKDNRIEGLSERLKPDFVGYDTAMEHNVSDRNQIPWGKLMEFYGRIPWNPDAQIGEAYDREWQDFNRSEDAFDTAWAIVKMPIVPGSLYPTEPRQDVSQKPNRSWKALFQDPKTDEIEPMIIDYIERLNGWGDTMRSYQGQIGEGIDRGKLKYHDEDDRFVSEDGELESATPDGRKSITNVNWVGDWNYGNKAYPAWTETREGLRGRGYAPALYDAIAYLMRENQNTPLSPSTEQKQSAKNMWRNNDRWPVRDDL